MSETIVVRNAEVGANECVNIRVISEKGPFRLDRVILSEEVGKDFMVTDLKIGKNSQFASCGAIPASFFAASTGEDRPLCTDILGRGSVITLNVTNMCGEDRLFSCDLVGELVSTSRFVDRLAVLGLGRTVLYPGQKAKVIAQSQVPAMLDLLVLSPGTLGGLRVRDVRIAGRSVVPEGGLVCEKLSFEPVMVQPCDWIIFEVENSEPAPVPLVPETPRVATRKTGFWVWLKRLGNDVGVEEEVQAPAREILLPLPKFFAGAIAGLLVVIPRE